MHLLAGTTTNISYSQVGMLKPFIFRNRFAETGFLPVTERSIVSGIIVTGRSALAISLSVDHLLLHLLLVALLSFMIVYNYDADLEVSDTCVRSSLLS